MSDNRDEGRPQPGSAQPGPDEPGPDAQDTRAFASPSAGEPSTSDLGDRSAGGEGTSDDMTATQPLSARFSDPTGFTDDLPPAAMASATAGTAPGGPTDASSDPAAVWSATTVADQTPEPARRVRTGTLVVGIVLALIGVGAILTGLGYHLDLQLATAIVLVTAAVVLLVNPLVQRNKAGQTERI